MQSSRLSKFQRYYRKNKEKVKLKNKRLYHENKIEIRKRQKKYYEQNKEYFQQKQSTTEYKTRQKNRMLKRRFGITLKQFNLLLEKQARKCAICLRSENKLPSFNGSGKFAVDHDHATGQVRGLLCRGCNLALGNFEENIPTLLNAVEYLIEYDKINN